MTPLPSAKLTPKRPQQLGAYLIDKGWITPEALAVSLAEQNTTQERLGTILVRSGFLTRQRLVDAILEISPDRIHGEELYDPKVPVELLENTGTLLVAETPGAIYLGTLGSELAVRQALSPFFPDREFRFVPLQPDRLDNYLVKLRGLQTDDSNLSERILRSALLAGASDVHIIPKPESYSLFFRVLGVLEHYQEGTLDEYLTLVARIKDLSRMDLAERRLPQDGGFQMEFSGRYVDLRVATIPGVDGENVVIRLLDPDNVRPSLDSLGITRIQEWRRGVSLPDGLCIIGGPTGSGKTSTLNATVREMDRLGRAIYTAEDPVEYRQAYVRQVNINPGVGLDFNRALRAFMRADPDIIMLGEVRDLETAKMAIRAAETGHLVLATLHTESIHGAYSRLRDIGLQEYELRYLLRAVLIQRLVRTLCSYCQGAGCNHCHGKGYGGRNPVSECAYFANEEEVSRMFAGEKWWPTIKEDAWELVRQGITDERELIRTFGPEILQMRPVDLAPGLAHG